MIQNIDEWMFENKDNKTIKKRKSIIDKKEVPKTFIDESDKFGYDDNEDEEE